MKKLHLLWTIIASGLLLAVSTAHAAEEIRLSVAASMTNVTKDIIGQYNRRAGHKVSIVPNFGPSGGLAKQINQGATGGYLCFRKPEMDDLSAR